MHIYLQDLSRHVKEEDLLRAFESFGQVASVRVTKEKLKGKARLSGYVDMPNDAEARAAITSLKGRNLKGKPIKIARLKGHRDGGRRGGSRRRAGDKTGGTRGGGRHF